MLHSGLLTGPNRGGVTAGGVLTGVEPGLGGEVLTRVEQGCGERS